MENLIDDEDAYVTRESLILSGTSVPPAANGEIYANVASQVLKDKMEFEINISVFHRLGLKPQNQAADKRPLVMRFCRRDLKRQILFTKLDNNNPNDTLYTNESLTKKRREIMYALRIMSNFHRDIVTGCSLWKEGVKHAQEGLHRCPTPVPGPVNTLSTLSWQSFAASILKNRWMIFSLPLSKILRLLSTSGNFFMLL